MDFVQIRPQDGRAVWLLTMIDEYTRECLDIGAGSSIPSPWDRVLFILPTHRLAWE